MARTGSTPKSTRTAGKGNNSLPLWLTISLAFLLVVLIYGLVTPSPPSAFDRPEAQSSGISAAPWQGVRQ